ncbi:proteasome subunit beta type-1 [Neodiprion pinetum]|uniref:Proteasome subunit beta type-1 n=1 Tax=Neodiprion lecontei TaxID=441921 RepID=A0A6J0C713_NEOLC|nr:proteasome subunit beta type-1 [Neodiprion lecontei]XP_046416065.1 proteasome subunit beta type-1 [Neodiprion fabricii]XP_046471930.1 proteasome subunit beta type-1 [Neodiprion pinetum]XP_046609742.1 proteasome subunit beta type-1 [Neodiprion virginianus]XP_046738241.1 proteasome subunit beta type-1 [Diprion similis]
MALLGGYSAGSFPDYEVQGAKKVHFSPYADNGGSVMAIAGEDYAIIAADSRLSTGFSIFTREQQKLFPLSNTTVLGCSGCWCDTLTLTRILQARMQMYKHEHHKELTTPATAQMLSTMLYYKRFFPYYISNILAGLDENGKGCVYSYDPIGHCERSNFRAGGSAGALLQPLLDNQIGYQNQEGVDKTPLPQDRALAILKDVFISAAERDIYTGDGIFINIITKDGIKADKFDLRKD